jgi:Ca2+-binding EF-hand superfamily protein
MKATRSILILAPGLLALSFLFAPLAAPAEETAPEKKLTKAQEKYDTDKDGKLSDEEKARAKEDTAAKAKLTRDEHLKQALAKYDANQNGKLDDDEKARMKADEAAAKEARKAEKEAKKAAKDTEGK